MLVIGINSILLVYWLRKEDIFISCKQWIQCRKRNICATKPALRTPNNLTKPLPPTLIQLNCGKSQPTNLSSPNQEIVHLSGPKDFLYFIITVMKGLSLTTEAHKTILTFQDKQCQHLKELDNSPVIIIVTPQITLHIPHDPAMKLKSNKIARCNQMFCESFHNS